MNEERMEAYIKAKLAELDRQKDMQPFLNRGELSFGIDSTTYGHLPAWNDLVAQKKKLKRWIWFDAFFLSLTVVFFTNNIFDKFIENWLKAVIGTLLLAGVIMLFFVVGTFYSLFFRFRKTEREIRKLIYQDILFQIKNNVGEDANISKEKIFHHA